MSDFSRANSHISCDFKSDLQNKMYYYLRRLVMPIKHGEKQKRLVDRACRSIHELCNIGFGYERTRKHFCKHTLPAPSELATARRALILKLFDQKRAQQQLGLARANLHLNDIYLGMKRLTQRVSKIEKSHGTIVPFRAPKSQLRGKKQHDQNQGVKVCN